MAHSLSDAVTGLTGCHNVRLLFTSCFVGEAVKVIAL